MVPTTGLNVDEDFAFLVSLLPEGWEEKAKELGALRRCRKVPDAATLLRVLLIHLSEGCSLRETALRAREGGIIALSDVAVMDRLKRSGEWFRWMGAGLMERWIRKQPSVVYGQRWRVRLVDATHIKEPGPTGSSWQVHYAIGLPSLACQELIVCGPKGDGESFTRFKAHAGDLFVGDRAYGVRPGIFHVAAGGGDVLVRFARTNLPAETPGGKRFDLLGHLRRLRGRTVGDWPVVLRDAQTSLPGRVCAVRKSRQATDRARRKALRKANKDGLTVKNETLEAAGYVFVFTTVAKEVLDASCALEMYRGRWQIELVFKRLKSILALGHLRKSDFEAASAWIQGKLFVALLVESLIRYAESFSPWGYPLNEGPVEESMPLARGTAHASPPATRGESSTGSEKDAGALALHRLVPSRGPA